LKIPNFSRPESGKIDEKNKTYVEMVCTKLRNIKPLVLKAYRKKQFVEGTKKKFSKLAKRTKERKIVICREDKDGKIVILNYEDYDATMTRELQQFKNIVRVCRWKRCLPSKIEKILQRPSG